MIEGIVSKPNIIKIPNSNIIKLLTAKKNLILKKFTLLKSIKDQKRNGGSI